VYLPYRQVKDNSIIGYIPRDLVVKTAVSAGPASVAPAVRAIIRRADPEQPVSDVFTLADIVEMDTASRTVQVRLLGAFAAIAFVLAGVGIHGLLAFAVSQRSREIGVRVALGAQRGDILAMLLKQSARLSMTGAVVGVALGYAAARWMQALLAGVTPADPLTFAATAALVVVMTVLGTLTPTLRALRVDPIDAMRAE
jgi:putative ABC transport system permease protein